MSPLTILKVLGRKATNEEAQKFLGRAVARVTIAAVTGQKVLATQTEIERRLDICHDCEYFSDQPMKCSQCNCFLNLKTRLETEHCPINKW